LHIIFDPLALGFFDPFVFAGEANSRQFLKALGRFAKLSQLSGIL